MKSKESGCWNTKLQGDSVGVHCGEEMEISFSSRASSFVLFTFYHYQNAINKFEPTLPLQLTQSLDSITPMLMFKTVQIIYISMPTFASRLCHVAGTVRSIWKRNQRCKFLDPQSDISRQQRREPNRLVGMVTVHLTALSCFLAPYNTMHWKHVLTAFRVSEIKVFLDGKVVMNQT